MTFHLDTTGHVVSVGDGTIRPRQPILFWSDLTPFAWGYVEAALRWAWVEAPDDTFRRTWMLQDNRPLFWRDDPPAFSDLAPETLAQIIADCERVCALYGFKTAEEGASFWDARQEKPGPLQNVFREAFGHLFPPLTVTLGDDGKVRFT